jgi:hypothetical protein
VERNADENDEKMETPGYHENLLDVGRTLDV